MIARRKTPRPKAIWTQTAGGLKPHGHGIAPESPQDAPKRPTRRSHPIRAVSKRMAKARGQYRREAAQFLRANPACERCGGKSTECHHRNGRAGKLLSNAAFFIATCTRCHRWIHDHPAEAQKLGLIAGKGEWGKA